MPKFRFKPEDRERMIDEFLNPPVLPSGKDEGDPSQREGLKGIDPAIAEKIKEIARRNKGLIK